ncbi:MAG TPA: hypothetical protein VKZ18_24820 [Polyangia bacterium]|nr:hypothetical protein [Polyangia bacterium]
MGKLNLTEKQRRLVAAEAEVDARTVDRLLSRDYVRPLVRGRIVAAMERLGFDVSELPPQQFIATGRGGPPGELVATGKMPTERVALARDDGDDDAGV